jgi:CIC family chloride channel protein
MSHQTRSKAAPESDPAHSGNSGDGQGPRWLHNPLGFIVLAAVVGAAAGLGAVAFRGLIAIFHNLLFLGKWSFSYNANLHTPPSPWGPFIILAPVVGAAGVAFLVKTFAPEARGNGVPEVMEAIHFQRGRIRPVVAVIKALASALSIGSGGSAGREGPITQIGSAIASILGQWLRVPDWQRMALLAGGAGGGIAATFDTPVGGLLFAVEIIMAEVSVRTLVPVIIATATATCVGRAVFHSRPSFLITTLETPYFHVTAPQVLLSYLVLGALAGAVSALFIVSIYRCEDFFKGWIDGSYFRQHLLGMLFVGLMLYGLVATTGHYYVQGVGYSTIQDLLRGVHFAVPLLLLLFALKLLVTALTLGSGASGGIFSPALFLGATVGAGYGTILEHLFPGLGVPPRAFALAGMAGVVGGSTGAAMAAVVMIFEMTLDYTIIVPLMVTVAASYAVRKAFSSESIYTLKLARRGHRLPQALRTGPTDARTAGEIMSPDFAPVSARQTVRNFAEAAPRKRLASTLLVADQDRLIGWVRKEAALETRRGGEESVTLGELADKKFIVVGEHTTLPDLIARMRARAVSMAVVVKGDSSLVLPEMVKGLIGQEQVADGLLQAPHPDED